MKTRIVALAIGCASVGWWGCQQASPSAQAAASPLRALSNPTLTATPARTIEQAAARVDVCSLLSAAEVSAIMGKPLVQSPHARDYGLDPSAEEKALADAGVKEGKGDTQNMASTMQSMMQGGPGAAMKMTATMMDQLAVSISADRDGMTEARARAAYEQAAGPVHGALNGPLHDEAHNVNDVVKVGNEISGVGDWAFTTNVVTGNLPGAAIRGRFLQAGKGPWHVTVSATVSPDPGVEVLDRQLSELARALLAKV